MDEMRWLLSRDPIRMLESLNEHVSGRKFCLFATACCRLNWEHFHSQLARTIIETCEHQADQPDPPTGMGLGLLVMVASLGTVNPGNVPGQTNAFMQPKNAALAAAQFTLSLGMSKRNCDDSPHLAEMVRCVFGNPFQPTTLDQACWTPTVESLAHGVYDDPDLPSGSLDPVRLSVLADALEDAGCLHEELIRHCRDYRLCLRCEG